MNSSKIGPISDFETVLRQALPKKVSQNILGKITITFLLRTKFACSTVKIGPISDFGTVHRQALPKEVIQNIFDNKITSK